MVHLKAAALAVVAPVLALAQQGAQTGPVSNQAPVRPSGGLELGNWVFAIVAILVIAVALFGARAMIQRRRNPPHGPQSPTPRGA